MASVSIKEEDFQALVVATVALWDSGMKEQAIVLDELARRMNRALALEAFPPTFQRQAANRYCESPLESMDLRIPKHCY